MSNVVNVCRCFSSIFSNQLITLVVFFHLLSFSFLHKHILILSDIGLLILSISFLAGFINFCGVIDKVIPVVFQGYKTITCAVNFYSIKHIGSFCVLYSIFVFLISSIPFVAFLYVVTALSRRSLYSSFVNLYMFEVLSAGVSVLFDDFIVFKSLVNFLWKLLFTLRNLIWCTKWILSSSNVIRSFPCGWHLLLFIQCLEEFCFRVPSLLFFSVALHVIVDAVVILVLTVKFHIVKDSFPPNFFNK